MFYFSNQNSNMAKLTKGRLAIKNRHYICKCGKGHSKDENRILFQSDLSIPLLWDIHPEIYQNLICKNARIFSQTHKRNRFLNKSYQIYWLFRFYYKKATGLKRFPGSFYFKAIKQNPSTTKSLLISCILLEWELFFTKIYTFY